MIAQLNVKEKPRCLHLERMTLEQIDATTMVVATVIARQVQQMKELVKEKIITDIGFTSIQMVSIMSFVDNTLSSF